ncbi:hypothetical protein ACH5RR_040538 [Cinchona calisaya]|uniref:Uncharacterized protein n=1 Tax=Cinchona calisaya TaxID=153742 RepID=A0ABD2XT74_9GENT
MAVYIDEEVWKCPKHPSKRSRNGICPTCLRDRLITLCPECANVRPCGCCPTTSSSSSSSSSSTSFSFFSSASSSRRGGRVSDLIDREPAFRRSRSVGIPFLFTRFAREKQAENENENDKNSISISPVRKKGRTAAFLAKFRLHRSKKREEVEEREIQNAKPEEKSDNFCNNIDGNECRQSSSSANIEEFANMMMRSRSVSVGMMNSGDGGRHSSASAKGKRWSFPSPMKVLRPKTPKMTSDRSPMCRG